MYVFGWSPGYCMRHVYLYYIMILSGVHTSSNQPFAAEKLLNMAIKWVSASGKPAAESQPCMLYFFSSKQWITQT